MTYTQVAKKMFKTAATRTQTPASTNTDPTFDDRVANTSVPGAKTPTGRLQGLQLYIQRIKAAAKRGYYGRGANVTQAKNGEYFLNLRNGRKIPLKTYFDSILQSKTGNLSQDLGAYLISGGKTKNFIFNWKNPLNSASEWLGLTVPYNPDERAIQSQIAIKRYLESQEIPTDGDFARTIYRLRRHMQLFNEHQERKGFGPYTKTPNVLNLLMKTHKDKNGQTYMSLPTPQEWEKAKTDWPSLREYRKQPGGGIYMKALDEMRKILKDSPELYPGGYFDPRLVETFQSALTLAKSKPQKSSYPFGSAGGTSSMVG